MGNQTTKKDERGVKRPLWDPRGLKTASIQDFEANGQVGVLDFAEKLAALRSIVNKAQRQRQDGEQRA